MTRTHALVNAASRWRLAYEDVVEGIHKYPVWSVLAWQDIRQRYRRSVLGPFWITLTMIVTIAGMGPLYAALFKLDMHEFIPYLALGLISWGLISTSILDGCATFIGSDSMIRSVRLPMSMYALRIISRNVIIFFHNTVAYVPFMIYLDITPSWTWLMALPGLMLIVIGSFPLSIILGIFCARFRDMQPIVGSIVQLAFFLTPILWKPESLGQRVAFAKYNPLYLFLDILRGPVYGYIPGANVYLGVGVVILILYAIAIPLFVRFRQRIAFWV